MLSQACFLFSSPIKEDGPREVLSCFHKIFFSNCIQSSCWRCNILLLFCQVFETLTFSGFQSLTTSLQENQVSSENKCLQKEKKEKTMSACAQMSNLFARTSPLFPWKSCPMDCPKARDLTASKLLVMLSKFGQPRNLACLDTWKPPVPQLVNGSPKQPHVEDWLEILSWLIHLLPLCRRNHMTKTNKKVKIN